MFGYISLHSASLVPNNSFIMLVNILLFQHYSCQIFVTYYSQNYASIIGSGLVHTLCYSLRSKLYNIARLLDCIYTATELNSVYRMARNFDGG